MKNFFLFSMFLLTVTGCEQYDLKPNHKDSEALPHDEPQFPIDISEDSSDLAITQNIRLGLMGSDSLSLIGKNIKVVTSDGVVTLRGAVGNKKEKEEIEKIVKKVSGIKEINNLLIVSQHP